MNFWALLFWVSMHRNHFKEASACMSLMSAFVVDWLTENDQACSKTNLCWAYGLYFFRKLFEPLFAIKRIFRIEKQSSGDGQQVAGC